MAGHGERHARRERWLQTAAFLGAVVVLGSVLYAALVQEDRGPETLPPLSPAPPTTPPYTRLADVRRYLSNALSPAPPTTPPYTPAGRPLSTPASTPYPVLHVFQVLTTPGTTPYPVFVFVGPSSLFMTPPDRTSGPDERSLRPEFLTPGAGYRMPVVIATARPVLGPWRAATPSSSPTPSPPVEGPLP